ncbi:MAG: cyclopropane-fatty-acyl-phospholipid synthase [Candidatus Binatia bacterium]|nr:cyclopropane-fatty-acyl-phospholipid synthase [Candidatus Binatia bacterium]
MTKTATYDSPATRSTVGQRLAERGWVPDAMIRAAIRRLLHTRLADEYGAGGDGLQRRQVEFHRSLAVGPIAVATERANAQHYEVPAAFYSEVLGDRRKYSSGYWPDGVADLTAAEEAMLALTCQRAGIEDGMDVFDLGCGWGALTLWIAEKYPNVTVVALSNSRSQRESIEATAAERGLRSVRVETADINSFDTELRFDRVVSVEMFEHMRNWDALLARVAMWLRPDGRALVHTFCHRELAYPYETERDDDWMGRFFFTGGIMPSVDTLPSFDHDLVTQDQWRVSGMHYADTARAWLDNLDHRRDRILPILEQCYGADQGSVWHGRWRLFFMACEELFRFRGGEEWFVSHTLLGHRTR